MTGRASTCPRTDPILVLESHQAVFSANGSATQMLSPICVFPEEIGRRLEKRPILSIAPQRAPRRASQLRSAGPDHPTRRGDSFTA